MLHHSPIDGLGRAPGARGLPAPAPGQERRQGRADDPAAARPRAHRPDHRRHRRPRRPLARHLVEAPRRPPPAAGQPPRPGGRRGRGAAAELEELGAEVDDRGLRRRRPRRSSQALLARIPRAHPLGAVIHAAGVLDDGTIDSLDPERLDARLRPQGRRRLAPARADRGARPLRLRPLLLGRGHPRQPRPGQLRRRQRLPRRPRRTSAAPRPAGHLARLGALGRAQRHDRSPGRDRPGADATRAASPRSPTEQGLALFDAALARTERAGALALGLDRGRRCARLAAAGALPPLLSGLVRARRAPRLGRRLAGADSSPRCPRPSASEHVLGAGRSRGRGGARPRLRPRRSSPTGLQGPRLRLADRGRAAQPARHRHRPAPARHPGLRLPDAPAPGRPPAEPKRGGAGRRSKQPRSGLRPRDEPIAIVGMACRFPGGVALARGAVGAGRRRGATRSPSFPTDRGWDLERALRPRPRPPRAPATPARAASCTTPPSSTPSSSGSARARRWRWTRSSGCCWRRPGRRSSDAGIDPTTLRGSPTGVFVGRHAPGLRGRGCSQAPRELEGYLAHRQRGQRRLRPVAYTLGLEGPAVTVDTACSSSLVALHLAVQALRAGECSLALAGGVTVMATPGHVRRVQPPARASPPTAAARRSPTAADGTGWAEGVGMLVLERLSDAAAQRPPGPRGGARLGGQPGRRLQRADRAERPVAAAGDPPGAGQRRARRPATSTRSRRTAPAPRWATRSRRRRCSPPTARTRDERPLWLGSVKSNIGHTQAAAGVAGVIKMVLAMRHGRPAARRCTSTPRRSHVDWAAGAVELLTEAVDLAAERTGRAGPASPRSASAAPTPT